jgi:WD40 repeat protein
LTLNLSETNAEIFSVDVAEMKFTQLFHKSDDFVTAFDIYPLDKKLICCANYSGRVIMYDYEMKTLVAEQQLKLLKRKSSISDVDVISIPHVSALTFSANGYHLMAGLDNGTVIILDPIVLKEIRYLHVSLSEILSLKFSPDSFFVTICDAKNNLMVYNHCKATEEEWTLVGGKSKLHQKRIVDTLYLLKVSLLPPTISHHHQNPKLNIPRLISLSEDKQIIEYDLTESLKENSKNLTVAFSKIIFQTSIPTAITLIYDNKKNEEQILIADNNGKFKIFDKNTFEIIMTYSAPVYDSHVMHFVSDILIFE